MLVEDNPGDARLVEELLREAPAPGWDIVWLKDKHSALQRLAEEPEPDAVLLDLGLPESRGLDTLRDVLAETTRIPVVVLTGHADSDLGGKAVRKGAQDYLRKDGVTSRELIRTLHYAVERQRTQEALRQAKEKVERIFEISPIGLAVIDSEQERPIQVNEAFLEQFGHGRGSLLSGKVQTRRLWADPDEWRWVVARVLQGETVRNLEARFRRGDGTEFDGLLSVAPLEVEERRHWLCAVGDISSIKEDERQLQYRVLHDSLTNLPNRSLFNDRLGHALDRHARTGETLAVLFVDVDRFKRINDTRGHGAGDRVLQAVARRLLDTVRQPDTVARFGGDEFAVLLEEASGKEEVTSVAGRIATAFTEPVDLEEGTISVDVSIGGAVHGKADDSAEPAPSDLLDRADRAMYRAKKTEGPSLVITASRD